MVRRPVPIRKYAPEPQRIECSVNPHHCIIYTDIRNKPRANVPPDVKNPLRILRSINRIFKCCCPVLFISKHDIHFFTSSRARVQGKSAEAPGVEFVLDRSPYRIAVTSFIWSSNTDRVIWTTEQGTFYGVVEHGNTFLSMLDSIFESYYIIIQCRNISIRFEFFNSLTNIIQRIRYHPVQLVYLKLDIALSQWYHLVCLP